jgi:hypothetical protein
VLRSDMGNYPGRRWDGYWTHLMHQSISIDLALGYSNKNGLIPEIHQFRPDVSGDIHSNYEMSRLEMQKLGLVIFLDTQIRTAWSIIIVEEIW